MTAQARDILIYKNEKLHMSAEPLANYLKNAKLTHALVAPNTACWRGYYSKWAIDNKKLFLIEWEGYILDYQKVGMDYLFPQEEIVFAKWFTGEIRIGMGEMVNYVHGGYSSIQEGNMYLLFENGELVNEYIKYLTKKEIEKIKKDQDNLPF
jgi:hypothetical protein